MADRITIDLKGIKEAKDNFKRYYERKKPDVEKALLIVGYDIEGDAKKGTPIWTGRLRNSITTSWSKTGPNYSRINEGVDRPSARRDEFVVVVGTNVKYAHMQEFGYWGDAPYPGPGEYPPRRGHEPAERPKEGFLYLTKAYEKHKNEAERKVRLVFKRR